MPRGEHLRNKANALPPVDREKIRDISEAVYRLGLGPKDTASMIAKDGGTPDKLRRRAAAFDRLTTEYLTVLGIPLPRIERAGLFSTDTELKETVEMPRLPA